jgi:hypothetical protein
MSIFRQPVTLFFQKRGFFCEPDRKKEKFYGPINKTLRLKVKAKIMPPGIPCAEAAFHRMTLNKKMLTPACMYNYFFIMCVASGERSASALFPG